MEQNIGLDGEEVAKVVEAATRVFSEKVEELEKDVQQKDQLIKDFEALVERLQESPDNKTNLEILQLIADGKLDEAAVLKEAQLEAEYEAGQKEFSQDFFDLALLETFTQPQKSLEHLQQAVNLDGENLEALNRLGVLQRRLGNFDEAIESFEKLQELGRTTK